MKGSCESSGRAEANHPFCTKKAAASSGSGGAQSAGVSGAWGSATNAMSFSMPCAVRTSVIEDPRNF